MTTNVLDGLLHRVEDSALRSALTTEVDLLRNTRTFGPVFERHFPENVRLYSHAVKRGIRVQLRDPVSDQTTWLVRSVHDQMAQQQYSNVINDFISTR